MPTTVDLIGYWEIEVPISSEEIEADKVVLSAISIPKGAILKDMEVVIHGRVWRYRTERIRHF